MNAEGLGSRALRIGLPAGILLGGLAVASLFPRSERRGPAEPEPGEAVVYRQQSDPPDPEPLAAGPPPARVEGRLPRANPFLSTRQATVLRPTESDPQPPTLDKAFPRQESWPSSRWGVSMGIGLPGAGPGDARTHKIADGDTLGALAQRYLGDARRAQELYEANRDVLTRPDILPIGRELKIPAQRSRGTP